MGDITELPERITDILRILENMMGRSPEIVKDPEQFKPSGFSVLIHNNELLRISIRGPVKSYERLGDFIELLGGCPKLEALYLNFMGLTEIPAFPEIPSLKILEMAVNKIDRINGNIGKLKGLVHLSLANNRIRTISNLEDLIELRRLNLSKNKITTIDGLDKLRKLEELNLSDNKIERIAGLENLANLKRLYLDGNKIGRMEGLSNLKNLELLSLQNNLISEISDLENLKNLNELNLDDNPLEGDFEDYGEFSAQYWVKKCAMETHETLNIYPAISIIGHSNSGKTSSIESVIEYLKKKGYIVFAIKRTRREGFSIDKPGKDTWKYSKAGATAVSISAPEETSIIYNHPLDPLLIIESLVKIAMSSGDIYENDRIIFLLEGYRDLPVKKILCGKDIEDISNQIDPSVVAISGIISENAQEAAEAERKYGIPVYNLMEDPSHIEEIINL